MISAVKNILKHPELKRKLIFTMGIIVICRLISNVPLPGIDLNELHRMMTEIANSKGGGLFGMANMFSGGALQKLSIGILGIMPYITASIIVQLMAPVFPQLEKLQREGVTGRQKLTQYTRYLTIIICVVQASMLLAAMNGPGMQAMLGLKESYALVHTPGTAFIITGVIVITAASLLIMWLGEQITMKGLGQGASIIITVNVLADAPRAWGILVDIYHNNSSAIIYFAILAALLIGVTAGTVCILQCLRKIPIKYAKKSTASSELSEKSSFLPLKLNHAGVMPIIFSNALLMFPAIVFTQINVPWIRAIGDSLRPSTPWYTIVSGLLILIFTFFWVATQFNPIQISEDLNRSGAFIPGHRPGEPTANFLNSTMTRITTAGAIFLVLIAILPQIVPLPGDNSNNQNYILTQFFGGTSLLIMVGVVLQTMQQIEVQLVQQNYEGFITGGRLRSR